MVMLLVVACAGDSVQVAPGAAEAPGAADPTAPPGRPEELPGAPEEAPIVYDGATRGGVFIYAPGSDGPSQFGLPWDPTLGFASVTEPFTEGLTAQWPDGSTRLVLSSGYVVGFDDELGLYYVDHTLHPNIVLHPHILHDAEPVDAELIVWLADRINYYRTWPDGMIDVVAIDDLTVRFYWDHMRNATPAITSGWVTSRLIYEAYGEEGLNANPVSAGPFRVVESVPGSHVIFERFENYWREGLPYLDGVQIVYLGDVLVQNIALQAEGEGRVDSVATNTAEQAGMFQDMGYHIMNLPNQTITIVMQNDLPADHPLMNPLVRQAISMAIDRDGITRALGFGVHIPTLQYIPSLMRGHVFDPNFGAPAFNPGRARELMAEAGFADGFSTQLFPQPGSVTDSQAVAMASNLADIGINVEIMVMEGTPFTEMRRETGWEGILVGNFISWFHAEDSASVNFEHREGLLPNWVSLVPSEEMLELITAIRIVGDNTAQAVALAEYVLDHNRLHLIPLWQQGRMHIVHPRIHGYTPTDHMLFFYRLWMED